MEIVGDGIIDGNVYRSESTVSAAGTTQGTGTVLTSDFNNVSTVAASSGVVLPALSFNAIAGTSASQAPHIFVLNTGANALSLYPPVGGTIDGGATNIAISVPIGQVWEGILTASLTWRTVSPSLAAGTGISVAVSAGNATITNAGVTSVAGTANQITASAATGAITLSLASAVTMPGTLTLVTGSATVTPLEMVSGALNTTAVAGALEFNGQNLYFSSVASQRAEIETSYLYRSNTATTLVSQTAAQSWLGNAGTPLTTGVTLQASTVYEFEGEFILSTTGGTSHTEAIGFSLNGGLTLNNMMASLERMAPGIPATYSEEVTTATATGTTVMSAAITASTTNTTYRIKGTLSVNATGSLLPTFAFSAAPGGTSTVAIGAWFRIRPIGAAGQISVGTWS